MTGVFALLVVLTLLRDDDAVLILPESREALADNRASSENAYRDLAAAIAAMPEKPPPLDVEDEDEPGELVPYEPPRGSIGELLGIRRPDDDGEFLTYLAACGPAFQHLQSGLSKPYLLLAKPDLSSYYRDSYSFTKGVASMGIHLIGAGSAGWGVMGNTRAGVALLSEAIRLSRMLASATNWLAVEERALREIRVLARSSTIRDLERVQKALSALGDPIVDARAILEVEWRRIDDALTFKPDDAVFEGETRGQIWVANRAARFIHDERDRILEKAGDSLPELEAWIEDAETSALPLIRDDIRWIVRRQLGQVERAMILQAEFRATLLTLALLRYEGTHGKFPAKLDALTPRFIDSIPASPLGETGFEYLREDGGFVIRSVATRLRQESTIVHVRYEPEE